MYEGFTDRAQQVVGFAQEEARMLNRATVGTEHLLLGLMRESEGAAAKSLVALGLSLESVRSEVEQLADRDQPALSDGIPFTPRAKLVLELSLDEAQRLGFDSVEAEHILLSIIREGWGLARFMCLKHCTSSQPSCASESFRKWYDVVRRKATIRFWCSTA